MICKSANNAHNNGHTRRKRVEILNYNRVVIIKLPNINNLHISRWQYKDGLYSVPYLLRDKMG